MGLRLDGMGLSGEIDVDALEEIGDLRIISLVNNSLAGSIPEFSRLRSLKALFLSGNDFSGEIRSDYFDKMDPLKKISLSENKFTGNIPASLGQLPNLKELNLENNEFSGQIPNFNHQTLISLNLGNNSLKGEIPTNLSKFNVNSFQGNPNLCGKPIGVLCNQRAEIGENPGLCEKTETSSIKCNVKAEISTGAGENGTVPIKADVHKAHRAKLVAATGTLAIMILSVVFCFVLRWMKLRNKASKVAGISKVDETIEVKVSKPGQTCKEVSKKSYESNGKASQTSNQKGGGGIGELVMVNTEKGVFGLPDLMKAAAEVLGNGVLGSSYKARMANRVTVVVKRMREMNAMGREEFDADLKRIGKLKHPNVLTPLAYHFRRDEKLFIFEYLPKGSLLYLLHGDRGPQHSEVNWSSRLGIIQGIARGLNYLYTELSSLDAPHGNIKSSNVLIGAENEPLLSEYGLCPFMNQEAQGLFAYKAPEAMETGKVTHKSDVYCLGIVILEILTGKFPSQYLINGEIGTDVVHWVESAVYEGREDELYDPEISSSGNYSEMEELIQIGIDCTDPNPETRLGMEEAIRRIGEITMEEKKSQCETNSVDGSGSGSGSSSSSSPEYETC